MMLVEVVVCSVDELEVVCTRETSSTIFYAYSNDLDDTVVSTTRENIFRFNNNYDYGYTKFANIRFDVRQEEDIEYHTNVFSFNTSVSSHMPYSSLGFNDSSTGSDLFKVIRNYVNNTKWSVCGSLLYILVKRYPNEIDISDLVAQLQENHVFVYIIAHDTPSGGNNPTALFNVASRTNGFCIFAGGWHFDYTTFSAIAVNYRPYQFIAQNFEVSGSGRKELPIFRTPNPHPRNEQVLVAITLQNHKRDVNYKSLNYTIADTKGDYRFTGPTSQWPLWGTGILAAPQLNGSTDYKLTIDYIYAPGQSQVVEVRLHSNYYFPDWLPFSN